MSKWFTYLTLGLALACGAVQAQEDAKRDKVRSFLEVSGRAELGKELIAQTLATLSEREGLPPGFLEAFHQAADPGALTERLITVYSNLDDEALDAAIAFYSTEAGARLAKLQAQHDAAIQTAAGEWIQETVGKAMEKLGMPSPRKQLEEARQHGNEAAAIGALKTISTAQALFREGDKDNDGNFQYAGDLTALGKTQLIDGKLASGQKQGYRFELCTGSEAPEFLWMAVASPIDAKSGSRHFMINQSGVIFYSKEAPFSLDRVKCEIPKGAVPVGK